MTTILLIVYVLICVGLIGLILIQHGKGADAGANFGGGSSGASDTVFGSQGSGNFLTKTTAILATAFFCLALFSAYLSGNILKQQKQSIEDQLINEKPAQDQEIPVIPDMIIPTTSEQDKPSLPESEQADTTTTINEVKEVKSEKVKVDNKEVVNASSTTNSSTPSKVE